MQIDPAALSRADAAASNAIASSKGSATNAPATQKSSSKALISVPRLELEPAYTELKAAIGDNWSEYKQSTALFLLGGWLFQYLRKHWVTSARLTPYAFYTTGHLNQSEYSSRVDHIICADPKTEHLHNNFVCAIIGNLTRDLPDHGVASWVSANDKPSVVSKPASGDAAEHRLKTEVMQLPARDRRRLKAIPEVRFGIVIGYASADDANGSFFLDSVTPTRRCPMSWKNIIWPSKSNYQARFLQVPVV